jgi:hypothetical protein
VPRGLTLALRGLAVLAVILIPAYALPEWSPAPGWLSRPGFAALSVAAVAVAIVCEALQRLLVARRQPALSSDQVGVDDALRAASMHAVAGAGLAMAALIVSELLFELSRAFRGLPARWTVTALGMAAAVLAVWAWIHLSGSTPWRVRRSAGTASS